MTDWMQLHVPKKIIMKKNDALFWIDDLKRVFF
jgi:hypothetical protein